MKRILFIALVIVVIAILVLSLGGCKQNKQNDEGIDEYRLVPIDGNTGNDYDNQKIYYDKDTRVMYVFVKIGKAGGLSPLYNADGTLRLYKADD